MVYDSKAIANQFLTLAIVEGVPVTHMMLQKLVFLAHGWSLGLFDEPLINDNVEAWRYGPVIPSLYYAFKRFGKEPITDLADDDDENPKPALIPSGEEHEVTRLLIKKIWDTYKDKDPIILSQMTHTPDSPWSKTVARYQKNPPPNLVIPEKYMQEYYAKQAESAPAQTVSAV